MHSEYTLIPIHKRDALLEQLQWIQADIREGKASMEMLPLQLANVQMVLQVWTDWDDECRRLISEAEEEQRQVSPEVSDISAASV